MRFPTLALLLLAAAPAWALDDGDRSALRGAIAGQIEAFRRGDTDAAYAFASPGIQSLFPARERFMSMVRESYAPVYRPRSYSFGEVRDLGDAATQLVRIIDAEGQAWSALYSFERQPDGTWRISGCQLLREPDEAA